MCKFIMKYCAEQKLLLLLKFLSKIYTCDIIISVGYNLWELDLNVKQFYDVCVNILHAVNINDIICISLHIKTASI